MLIVPLNKRFRLTIPDHYLEYGGGMAGREGCRGIIRLDRAVAQRRSRASGLTCLLAEAIRGFDSGLLPGPLACSAAVLCKSFVFSSLPIRKVLVLDFAGASAPPLSLFSLLFSASYPQDRRSYYMFFNYML